MSAPIFKLTLEVRRSGQLADADATPTLADSASLYGVRRADTQAVVVAAGTAMTRDGAGLYSYTLGSYVQGLAYEYSTRSVVGGREYFYSKRVVAPVEVVDVDDGTDAYLTIAQADALAATLPGLRAWRGVSDVAIKSALLVQASDDVDNGMRYQGRKYGGSQVRAFPRYHGGTPTGLGATCAMVSASVWDWDDTADVPIVPLNVKKAVLMQADAIAAGNREGRLDAQHDGVVYDQSGALAESYKASDAVGLQTGLCRAAHQLLKKYRLATGSIL